MRTPVRLAVVAAGLGAVFTAAVGVGAAVGPVGAPEAHPAAAAPTPEPAATGTGYLLDVLDERPAAGTTTVAFRVLGPDGTPVTGYTADHGEDLHLVAVRADLSGYQHVHPDLAPDGTWRVPLTLTPGSWHLVADTTPAGAEDLALTADLQVAGSYDPQSVPEPAPVTEVDGYTVVLTGEPAAGAESELTLSISRDGRPVLDLQPYLGAYGHLVVLREGDLEYLHVHPVEDPHVAPAAGPHVAFAATAPSAGTYRLFLDFRHGDAVHIAGFTVEVTGTAASDATAGHGHGG
ncbi:hypothetical protein ACU610_11985 [Geodermatophilus sp. URMC 61]|uniref:hypothetical protein n=1 Tax=Geodermatophilus sp. URMC 61 TaxID=3423411 RepID=UPI00406C0126